MSTRGAVAVVAQKRAVVREGGCPLKSRIHKLASRSRLARCRAFRAGGDEGSPTPHTHMPPAVCRGALDLSAASRTRRTRAPSPQLPVAATSSNPSPLLAEHHSPRAPPLFAR